ncbi:MAG: hypothetical protein KIT31_08980 [Deltaproteobacteria bacterium]|nr:hypothetical protein [Deltaproteobacteria bacterium]
MKKLRIVSYAINGRGVGHLVRQLSILRWVRRYAALLGVNAEVWVLTTSEADTLARREGVPAFKMPSKIMMRDAGIEPTRWLAVARQWVMNAIAGLSPDVLVVDTFPGGSFGELLSVLEMVPARVLVARAVRDQIAGDDAYRALLPMYQRTVIPDERGVGPILIREREELLDRDTARAALGVPAGRRAAYVTLGGGGDEMCARVLPPLTDKLVARGWHVVVGAGPLYMGPERRGPNITWMDRYVPLELLPGVDAAVSAGGYNAVTELMFAGVPTVFLPQPRIADDQEERARAAAAAGAGRLATSIDEIRICSRRPAIPGGAGARAGERCARRGGRVLAAALPAADVAMAQSVLSPLAWARAQRLGASALELVSLVAGDAPSVHKDHDAVIAMHLGADAVPSRRSQPASARVDRFLRIAEAARPPGDTALSIVRGLRKKFPTASLDGVVDACEVLFPAWARFDDWMGAVSLVNALPIQRGMALADAAGAIAGWLAREDDLFDALRSFARLEGNGARPLPDVLRSLGAPTNGVGAEA